jgi:hypothetical protein
MIPSALLILAILPLAEPVPGGHRGEAVEPSKQPPVSALKAEPVEDGFYLIPAFVKDGAYRWTGINWNPSPSERSQLYGQLRNLIAGGCAGKAASPPDGLPTTLIQVKRMGERFVLYDACDGNAPRIEIIDGLLEFHPGGGELEVVALSSGRKTARGFDLTGRGRDCREKPLRFQIEPMPDAGWYRVQLPDHFPGDRSLPWVTIEVARTLDVLVNVCNAGRAAEFPFAHGDRRGDPSPSGAAP